MAPTLKDIAQKARVSISTVLMVLNEKGRISDETRERVKRIIAQSGYKRMPHARALGVVGTLPSELLPDLQLAAAEYGYDLLRLAGPETLTEIAPGQKISGVIVYGGQWDPQTLDGIATRHPTVLLGGHARHPHVDTIWVDSAAGIDLAVNYLAERGHRKVALVNGPPDTPTSWEKRAGFERAVATFPSPLEGIVVSCAAFDGASARQAALELVAAAPDVTAIIVGETLIYSPVLDLLLDRRLSIPQDVSLIVFRDHPDLLHTVPPLSPIGFSTLDIARGTLRQLVRRIHEPMARGTRLLFRPYLIERNSVATVQERVN